MTAPDLVEVIAAAIRGHAASWTFDEHRSRLECACGAEVIAGDASAHQARAVLAALEGAGNIQFGVKGEGRVKEYGRDRRRAQLEARRRRATLVSRLTMPWTKVADRG